MDLVAIPFGIALHNCHTVSLQRSVIDFVAISIGIAVSLRPHAFAHVLHELPCCVIAEVCDRLCSNQHWHCREPQASGTSFEPPAAASEFVHHSKLCVIAGWGSGCRRSIHHLQCSHQPPALVSRLQHQSQRCKHANSLH